MSLAEQSQQWSPTSVQVTVLQARGLRTKGKNGTNDAYAIMQVGKHKFSTSVSEKSVAPVWGEEASFDLPLSLSLSPGERCTLQVSVMHRALLGADKTLGQVTVNLLELYDNKSRNKSEWFKLMGKTGKPDKDRGEVLLDIQFMKNNMTASMFDLSGLDKSRSRLGKLKDKLKGKKKDGMSDSASAIVPSVGQILTDSEGEEEEAGVTPETKKKSKLKSLFAPKGLHRNISQSMSTLPTLPEKDSAISLSRSSGLNVESPEGKKKFKLFKHKRTDSSDSKVSQGSFLGQGISQSNLCINGSHVYTEDAENKTSRAGSTLSLNSSGHGSMEDLRRGPNKKIFTSSVDLQTHESEAEEMRRRQEEQRKQEEMRKRLEEESRRQIEEEEREQLRMEEERARREREEERKQIEREEEMMKLERDEERKRFQREEEMRLEKLEEEKRRIEREEKRKQIEREEEIMKLQKLEEEKIRIKREEERKRIEREEEIMRLEKLEEEKRRIEREEERKRIEREEDMMRLEKLEEEKRRIEREEEMIRLEKLEEEKRRIEREEERKRIDREEEMMRLEKLEEEKRWIEKEEERKRTEREDMEKQRRIHEEEMQRKEEINQIQRQQDKARYEEERKVEEEQIKAQERKREEERRIREERRRIEQEEKAKLEMETMKREEEMRRIETEKRPAEEEDRLKKEKMEERARRMIEDKERKERESIRLEKERMELERKEKEDEKLTMERERKKAEEEEKKRKLKADQEKEELQRRKKEEMNVEKRPEVKPRSARLNASKKADPIVSEYSLSANPFQESLLSDENFEQTAGAQSEAHGRSSKVYPVKPSSSISGTFFSQASLPNTNPFLDNSEADIDNASLGDASERSEKKRRAPRPPQNKTQDASLEDLSSSRKAEDGSVFSSRQEKRQAPLPPDVSKNNRVLNEEHAQESVTSPQEETNPYIFPNARTTKHSKGPAPPKPTPKSTFKEHLAPVPEFKEQDSCGSPTSESCLDQPNNNLVSDTKLQSKWKSQAPLPPVDRKSTNRLERQDQDKTLNVNSDHSTSVIYLPGLNSPSTSSRAPETAPSHMSGNKTLPQATVSPIDTQKVSGQNHGGGLKRTGDPTFRPSRPHAVKPLSTIDSQQDFKENQDNFTSAKIAEGVQVKMKAPETRRTGPYSQLTHEELVNMLEKQKDQLSEKNAKIIELEQYIDNLLVRVIEEQPSILMSLNMMKKSA